MREEEEIIGRDFVDSEEGSDSGYLPSKKDKKELKKAEKKAEKKLQKEIEDSLEIGTPDPWERYRLLTDVMDMYSKISEMADRKTRFALVILGAVNAVNLFVVARPEVVMGDKKTAAGWMGLYLTVYIGISLYIFIQSIGALRPRVSTLMTKVVNPDPNGRPLLGLRFIGNIRAASLENYYDSWKQAQYGDVNREVALGIKTIAEVVTSKYEVLHKMYSGLFILVFLSAGLILVLGLVRIFS